MQEQKSSAGMGEQCEDRRAVRELKCEAKMEEWCGNGGVVREQRN